ncbi:XapX domain-containing protein [Halorussus halophilus]|uniref:XapX domain-containing protein n=1 Tax=Halorussus halophilus TaxID=2650975 RepID=UPI0013010A0F|nr:DUF1427 family protein [Halorussus halophilus]
MNTTITILALLTGFVTGALFELLQLPAPVPPELPGVMGIVGVYLGFKVVSYLGYSVDLLKMLGLAG